MFMIYHFAKKNTQLLLLCTWRFILGNKTWPTKEMDIFLSSQSSQFSGFGLSDLEDESESPGSVSPPSSVRTSDLSFDEESDGASDLSDRNPDSDIEEDNDELPDSDGEFDSQLSEIPSSQLTSTSDEDFWSEQLEDIDIPDFSEMTGPVHMLPLNAQAVDFFQLFFEEGFFQHLAEQTNLYAQQTSENDQHWEEVNKIYHIIKY